MDDHCQKTAYVLTYYSMLTIVPVIAVAVKILDSATNKRPRAQKEHNPQKKELTSVG